MTWAVVRDAWRKWVADLSSTKTQAGYAGVAVTLALVIRGLHVATTAQDIAMLMGAAAPLVGILLAAWGVVKVAEIRQNGVTK